MTENAYDYARERHEADMDTDLPVWIGSTPYDPADVPDLSDVEDFR